MSRVLALAVAALFSQACLVVSVNPAHTRDTLVWEPALLGTWENPEDRSSVVFQQAEWQSYRVGYVHPIEEGQLTGYLTRIGDDLYLDVMPARGEDRGSFLLPLHVTFRLTLKDDRLELATLSYDWFFDRFRSPRTVPGLEVIKDEKENALITSSTAALRAWIARQVSGGPAFSATAVFVRK